MALGTTNITTAAVNAELGSPYTTPRLVSQLCAHANAGRICSFFGPGTLAVDASKNVYWIAPTSNYKLGDFRSYNRTSTMPSFPNATHNWGPSGGSTNITMTTLPEQMNLYFINSGATYIHYRGYLSTTNRGLESSVWDSQITLLTNSSVSALSGHTRTQTSRPSSPQIQTFSNFVTTGLSTPNDYIYFDAFYCNSSGTRLVNFGDAIANGYATYTLHQLQQPYVTGSGTCLTPSGGYTAAFPVTWSASSYCSSGNVNMTYASSSFAFYVKVFAIYGGATRSMAVSNATITLTHSGGSQTVYTGSIPTTGRYCSGTRSSGTWNYDEVGLVTVSVGSTTYYTGYYSC